MKDTYTDADKFTETPSPLDAEREKQIRSGYGAMVIAAGMAGGWRDGGKHGPVVQAAKLFCILFAFLVPSLLMIDVALD